MIYSIQRPVGLLVLKIKKNTNGVVKNSFVLLCFIIRDSEGVLVISNGYGFERCHGVSDKTLRIRSLKTNTWNSAWVDIVFNR